MVARKIQMAACQFPLPRALPPSTEVITDGRRQMLEIQRKWRKRMGVSPAQ